MIYIPYVLLFFGLIVLLSSFVTVKQGTIAVITIFGKYRRQLRPGLSLKIPLIEQIHSRISIQNRSVELSFQAVTHDQANVYFKAMLLYSVLNHDEETIKNVAFKFVDANNLMQALTCTIEGSIRAYVATQNRPMYWPREMSNCRPCETSDRPGIGKLGLPPTRPAVERYHF